ncbi:DUF1707 SHOCT-like domain-containing protein [Conexibacter arvalis]|uniref:DUF1707 domain-containing protein n=1 Tax=Conexibacter arvalis TaxID=912552 RepID=A0A840IJJ2_9ACTN|nr:DUF1707 domain-containing protein [Conexibacter arvalis]MBB4664098.1 hypothetical protein [Conexibacter arvalis]
MLPDDPTLRASDAERERAADALRDHCAVGRITPEELDERTDAVYAARTVSELRALLSDLPPLPAAPPRPGHDPRRERAKRRALHRAGSWALLSLAMVAIWLATGASGHFWPIWVMLGAGIRVGMVTWSELGPAAAARRPIGQGSAAPPLPPGEEARERHGRR